MGRRNGKGYRPGFPAPAVVGHRIANMTALLALSLFFAVTNPLALCSDSGTQLCLFDPEKFMEDAFFDGKSIGFEDKHADILEGALDNAGPVEGALDNAGPVEDQEKMTVLSRLARKLKEGRLARKLKEEKLARDFREDKLDLKVKEAILNPKRKLAGVAPTFEEIILNPKLKEDAEKLDLTGAFLGPKLIQRFEFSCPLKAQEQAKSVVNAVKKQKNIDSQIETTEWSLARALVNELTGEEDAETTLTEKLLYALETPLDTLLMDSPKFLYAFASELSKASVAATSKIIEKALEKGETLEKALEKAFEKGKVISIQFTPINPEASPTRLQTTITTTRNLLGATERKKANAKVEVEVEVEVEAKLEGQEVPGGEFRIPAATREKVKVTRESAGLFAGLPVFPGLPGKVVFDQENQQTRLVFDQENQQTRLFDQENQQKNQQTGDSRYFAGMTGVTVIPVILVIFVIAVLNWRSRQRKSGYFANAGRLQK